MANDEYYSKFKAQAEEQWNAMVRETERLKRSSEELEKSRIALKQEWLLREREFDDFRQKWAADSEIEFVPQGSKEWDIMWAQVSERYGNDGLHRLALEGRLLDGWNYLGTKLGEHCFYHPKLPSSGLPEILRLMTVSEGKMLSERDWKAGLKAVKLELETRRQIRTEELTRKTEQEQNTAWKIGIVILVAILILGAIALITPK